MSTFRTLRAAIALVLMALAPSGPAMAAIMCAMDQPESTLSMPSGDRYDMVMGDCAIACAPMCQALPFTFEPSSSLQPAISLGATLATVAIVLPTGGPEPPPPRTL